MDNMVKVEISALLGDTLQSVNGVKYQIEQIQEAFGDSSRLQKSIQWLNMVNYELDGML